MPRGQPTSPQMVAEIRRLRKKKKLTANAISALTGVPISTIGYILRHTPIRAVVVSGSIIPPDRSTEAVWCVACHATVYPPCLVCQLKVLGARR